MKKLIVGLMVATALLIGTVATAQLVNVDRTGRDTWYLDDTELWFGMLPDVKMGFDTAQTPDSMVIGVGAQSNQLILMEMADLGTDAAMALASYPALTIMSADLSNYVQFGSDGTDAFITVDSGSLTIPAIAMAGDLEMSTYDINMGSATVDAGSFTMIDGAQVGDDEVVFALSGDGAGDFSIETDDGSITLTAGDQIVLASVGEEVDITGAVLDMNPDMTGTQSIISITPTATLAAGSVWAAVDIAGGALDPLTGAASTIIGVSLDNATTISADGNANIIGANFTGSAGDNNSGYRFAYTEMTADKNQQGLVASGGSLVLSATGTYVGANIEFDSMTRDGGAPILQGVKVQLPVDYTAFGVSYAGLFSGDGRTVQLANDTYAIDALGSSRFLHANNTTFSIDGTTTPHITTAAHFNMEMTSDTTTATDDISLATVNGFRGAADTGSTYTWNSTLTTGNMATGEFSAVYMGSFDSSLAVTATSNTSVFYAFTPTVGASSNDYGLLVEAGYDVGVYSESTLGVNIGTAIGLPGTVLVMDDAADVDATLSLQNDGFGAHITTGVAAENLELDPATTGHVVAVNAAADAAADMVELRNSYESATGEVAATSDLLFTVQASVDSGTSWAAAAAAKISAYKVADFWTAGGSADNDAGLKFYTVDAGTETLALTVDNAQASLFAGTVRSSATADIGWSIVAGINTACNTTCTSACVAGQDSDAAGILVGCTDAAADLCICAGAS